MPTKEHGRVLTEEKPVIYKVIRSDASLGQKVMDTLREAVGENLSVRVTIVKGADVFTRDGTLNGVKDFDYILVGSEKIPFIDRWQAVTKITGGNLSCENELVISLFAKQGWYGCYEMQHIPESELKKLKRDSFGIK